MAPIVKVVCESKIGTKVRPPSELSHTPPAASPTIMSPVLGSTAFADDLPVTVWGLPTFVPVTLVARFIGRGPSGVHCGTKTDSDDAPGLRAAGIAIICAVALAIA